MRRVDHLPLWIGTARDARDLRSVLDAGIEAIVDLAMEEPPVSPTRELVYLRFPLLDGDGKPLWLLQLAVNGIRQLLANNIPTLVACSAGMSRSPAVVSTAVAQLNNEPAESVLERLRGVGPVDVSPGLWQSLRLVCQDARPNGRF
ncbi:dual specificity protein phosphatase family protein [Fimbriiglobus ruber]|uniref:dual specificity protein phosphatase family protein n=1 Tax=Fimbriiglobus ruber TaxID=1908690 RepID=UPI000B4B6751|nr:dual specificity protein phosphatase [Fimbriiglobus ruber]